MAHSNARATAPTTLDAAGSEPAAPAVEALEGTLHALDPRILDRMTLVPGDVDIWVAMVAEAADADLAVQFDKVLNEDERKKHAKFLFEKDRRRYLVTRTAVRRVVPFVREQEMAFDALRRSA